MLSLEKKSEIILKNFTSKNESYWHKMQEKMVLRLFHLASLKVPAYKDFLKKNKVQPNKIKNIYDFSYIPKINKNNYLKFYPYKDLLWDGHLKKPITIHATSGSTGEPTYFQRELKFDWRREVILENYFRYNKISISEPTLFIITFGMGIWSAGMGIYTAAYLTTNKNKFPISIVCPGVSKVEVLKILKNISPNYKQTIIAGYPPFVKDILDEALIEGIDLKKVNARYIFTGEVFTEEFRDYLASKTKIKNIYTDTMNTYGTSELGATAIETPLSILIRRSAYNNKKIFTDLFGNIEKTPTIAQYIPYFVNFESENGELLLTGDSPIPLIRYESGDNGGVISYSKIKKIFFQNELDIEKETKKYKITTSIYKLPFVYVFERKNLTASLYGILIYPEFIKSALYSKKLNAFASSKFTMLVKYDKKHNQYLEINIELKKGVNFKNKYKNIANKIVINTLITKSSEYRELASNLKTKVHPRLVFWPYEHPEHFSPGLKQKWVKK